MPTILITGANRGIGLEFARQYAADGWHVIACCRAPATADALKEMPDIQIEALDVGDQASIIALSEKLKTTTLDVLINNAGIYSGTGIKGRDFPHDNSDTSQTFGSIDGDQWAKVLYINTISPIMMLQSFLPNLQKGKDSRIINITSGMGSLTNMGGGSIAYRSSKAGLNAAMRAITDDLKALKIIIANLHPGWVKTDMGGARANLTPTQSVENMRRTIAELGIDRTGQFLNYDGQVMAW